MASANPVGVAFEIIGSLLDLILKALAAGALWVLVRGVHAGRIDTAPRLRSRRCSSPSPEPAVEENPTVWKRGEAAGAVWRTADEAATGAKGASRLPTPEAPAAGAIFRDEADPNGQAEQRP